MRARILAALLIMSPILLHAGTVTNMTPVFTTNVVTALPSFREVNGQLYNTELSVSWQKFQGRCLRVTTNGVVVEILTPVYGRLDESPGWIEHGEQIGMNPSQQVLLRYDGSGKLIFLTNYPSALQPAATQEFSFRAMKTGTVDFDDNKFELWDYGTPHVVMVVTTNYVRAKKIGD